MLYICRKTNTLLNFIGLASLLYNRVYLVHYFVFVPACFAQPITILRFIIHACVIFFYRPTFISLFMPVITFFKQCNIKRDCNGCVACKLGHACAAHVIVLPH